MRKYTHTEKLAYHNQHPKIRYTVFGCFNANVCVYEGAKALCEWYKKAYNSKLTIKPIR
jgi:hypothetical protein